MPAPIHAFFDYDGTLIEGDSILYWLRFYYGQRPLRRVFQVANAFGLLLRLTGLISSHTLKRVFLWPLSFEKPAALDKMAAAFVRDDLSRRFHPTVLDRLREHCSKGDKVVVISASCTFYLNHLRDLLPEGCLLLGTEVEWGKGFFGLPVYVDGNLRGENKIRRLRELGFGDTGRGAQGYSDHHHDIPLLRFVEFPVCIRPTAKLRKLAVAEGWPIWELPNQQPMWKLKLEALRLMLLAV